MYQESESSTFTHDGKKYDLNIVLQCVDNNKVTKVAVNDLTWVLPYTVVDINRVEKADLTVPILVTMDLKNRVTVIDGAHRLTKAVNENVVSLPAKWVTKTILKKALLF